MAQHSPSCYVIGGGGHAKVVIRTLQSAGYRVVTVFDDDPTKYGQSVLGIPIVGPVESIEAATPMPAVVAVGNNAIRKRISESLRLDWLTVIHPAAFVDATVELSPGTVVMAGCVIQPDCRIGRHTIINTSASIDHDTRIGSFAHVGPGCRIAGDCELGEEVFMGVGSVVLPGRTIGERSTVGGAACVTRNVPAYCVAKGVPARW